ncbi:LLM class F420-dependent oxidoreductase [Gordonia sp. CPCC 206044]|uniref:LLM class F420-dependent oxidoreductase n=1 Tax=Gordonia sp. CPCC 206044 TaxID=3140793 RepID=UPI003AF3D7A6
MRIGIATPVVVAHPSTRQAWESDATIDDLAHIAALADRLGFHHLTCSEHVAVPVEVAHERGGTYWDPLATLGFLAARTDRIRLATQVVVLGYHHPLAIAKRYGTLDRVSGGRLILGLGVGSLEAEFDLLGASFADRGARADDALVALRGSMSTATPSHHGAFYDYRDVVIEPHAVQPRVPFWIGGRTMRSLRRGLEHGDGWVPFGLGPAELQTMLTRVTVPPTFEVVLSTGTPLDPTDRARTGRALSRLRDVGATIANVSIAARSADHYCEQLERLHRIAGDEGATFGESRD